MKVKEAIVLAGGLGTRLQSVIPDLPKCMAPVNGKPFLSYLIDYFVKEGVERFIFSLGYKHQVIEDYLKMHYAGVDFVVSLEATPLGTGGAIKLACNMVKEKTAAVLNGDTLFKVDLSKIAAFHHMCGAHCTLSLKPMTRSDRYGIVELNKDYSIKNFSEKTSNQSGYINGGVYILNVPKFNLEDLNEKFSFEKDYLEKYYRQRRIYGVVQDGYFIDIGIPEDLERVGRELGIGN